MPIQSEVNEQMPTGGASFGGLFHKEAFNSSVYPKPGARRTERQEHRASAKHPVSQHKASVFFAMGKEVQKPSRLRMQVDKFADAESKKPKDFWADAKQTFEAQQKARLEAGELADYEITEKDPNPVTWCPHPSLLRGKCQLNKPRALDWGIDITQAKGYDCPFWDAPRHRFEGTAALPEARPVTPIRAHRWRNAEDWDNPDMHAPWKITHALPKTHSMVELSRTSRASASMA